MSTDYQVQGEGPVYRIGGKILMVAPTICPCGGTLAWLELEGTAILTPTAKWNLLGCACHTDPLFKVHFNDIINPGPAYNSIVRGINSVVADLKEVGAEEEVTSDMREALEGEPPNGSQQ